MREAINIKNTLSNQYLVIGVVEIQLTLLRRGKVGSQRGIKNMDKTRRLQCVSGFSSDTILVYSAKKGIKSNQITNHDIKVPPIEINLRKVFLCVLLACALALILY